jgi:lipoprotein-releasing system ATP-binding protein
MSEAVLELRCIARHYQQGGELLKVLSDFSLRVSAGEMVAVIGPSGCGKSTLLHVAGLLDTPSYGHVRIAGHDATSAGDALRTRLRREHIGFVYQFHHLLPEFSAEENIVLPQLIAGEDRRRAKERAAALLAEFGLSQRAAHRPAALSGGEQQRVAIARALANAPQLLLADEPTGNLDTQTGEQVFSLLQRQAKERGLAALIATHNPDLARRMDRVVRLGAP